MSASRATPRDHQYRLERLEKRLALAEAQSASTVEMGWLDTGSSYYYVNGAAVDEGVCPYTIRPWGHSSYGTYYDGALGRDCPDYSGIALFWPRVPVASALDDMRLNWVQGGPTFARFDLPPGVWSIDATVWIEKAYSITDFWLDPAGLHQRFTLYLRPMSHWPGVDPESGAAPIDPSLAYFWDGTTYGVASTKLIWPATGNGYPGIGFEESLSNYPAFMGDSFWRWSVEGRDVWFEDSVIFRPTGTDDLEWVEYDTLHLHVVGAFPDGDSFHVHGEYSGWLNGEHSNVDSATIEVLSWHVSATQVAAASTIPEAR